MQLFIGNKNYSSWSMRPWVMLREAQIPFDEVMLRFDSFEAGSKFKTTIAQHSPVGKVPLLVHEGLAIWDSLAIAEYVAETFPDAQLWPHARQHRARARSVCAEMHAAFNALRTHLPMNIEAQLPEVGARVLREQPEVHADLNRLMQMWQSLLDDSGGPMLFGRFSIADAFFAPVVMRLRTYGIEVPDAVAAYMDQVQALASVEAWCAQALAEHDFVRFDEPYRSHR